MSQDMLHRRGLLAALGAAAGALAIGTRRVAAQVASTTFRPVVHEQDQWLDKLTGKHRVVVDVTSAVGVTDMLRFVGNIYEGNRTGYGVEQSDLATVVILRHSATSFGYSDVLWAKYGKGLSDATSYAIPAGGEVPKTNPYYTAAALEGLVKRGVQFGVCATASRAISRRLAGSGGDAEAIFKELVANLNPSSRIVPAGVIALTRAQEYGYSVLHVG